MERVAWKGRIKPGMRDEYVRRHNEISKDMKAALKAAGVCNYTIFCAGDELFGYYECEKGVAFAQKTQADSAVVQEWERSMSDVMYPLIDPDTGAQTRMAEVFRLETV